MVVSSPDQIEDLIKQHYGTDTTRWRKFSSSSAKLGASAMREGDGEAAVEAEANAKPRSFVLSIHLYQAIQDIGAISLLTFETNQIRYRVDGALYEMGATARHLALPVISRVKVMANMNMQRDDCPAAASNKYCGRQCGSSRFQLYRQHLERASCARIDRSIVNLDLERWACLITSTIIFSRSSIAPTASFRDRADGFWKDDHALFVSPQDQHHRFEAAHAEERRRIDLEGMCRCQ